MYPLPKQLDSVLQTKFTIGWVLVGKKERVDMSMMIQSDCCNEPMSGSQIDHEICPKCGEHCTVVFDRSEERIVSFAQQRRAERLRKWSKNENEK